MNLYRTSAMTATASPRTNAFGDAAEAARKTLRLLATKRVAPTPDNYRQCYFEIVGESDPLAAPVQEQVLPWGTLIGDLLRQCRHDGHPAFRIALPQRIVRMQRREFYRISTSVISPLKCKVRLDNGTDAEITLLDLSVGGVALIDQHHAIDLEPGNIFPDCRIDLPGQGTLHTGLQVCNTFEVTLRSGLACKRSGCRFMDISESDRGMVQRYITQLEREQRSKGMLG